LPWWTSRLYEEGLVEEFARRPDADGVTYTEDGEPVQVVPLEAMGVRWG
jgi:hypothetical protein